ncbi:MAG: hypothetical protein P8178_13535 [Candidatus Thiodiazotropha sp.]
MNKLEAARIFQSETNPDSGVPTNMHLAYWNRKVQRPSYDVLKRDVDQLGYSATGRKYGVSDNAIRKWLKAYDAADK